MHPSDSGPVFGVHFIDTETEAQKNEMINMKFLEASLALPLGLSCPGARVPWYHFGYWSSALFP